MNRVRVFMSKDLGKRCDIHESSDTAGLGEYAVMNRQLYDEYIRFDELQSKWENLIGKVLDGEVSQEELLSIVSLDESNRCQSVGLIIRNYRTANSISLSRLAMEVGVSNVEMGQIERDLTEPTAEQCIKIERLLDMPTGCIGRKKT